jgi:hypothetical protein
MEWIQSIFDANPGISPANSGVGTALLILLLAFAIGHVVAWVYMWTHAGLSYSQMFTASLVALPVLVALFMLLVASNVFIALGMLAVFTMIRFRNVLKDTRDTVFILWSIVEGLAAGTGHYGVALTGAVVIALVFLYLRVTGFGGRHRYDVIVSFEWSATGANGGNDGIGRGGSMDDLRAVLRRHGARVQLASQRDLDEDRMDLSYRLLLRNPNRSRDLLTELKATPGIDRPTLYHREDEAEV